MSPDKRLLEALLDSWERNNIILLNLLRALPAGREALAWSDGWHESDTHLDPGKSEWKDSRMDGKGGRPAVREFSDQIGRSYERH
jgi:hypothetical protein